MSTRDLKGVYTSFRDRQSRIGKCEKLVASTHQTSLYVMECHLPKPILGVASLVFARVWHKHLAHVNENGLLNVTWNGNADGPPQLSHDHSAVWKFCAIGKTHRTSIS